MFYDSKNHKKKSTLNFLNRLGQVSFSYIHNINNMFHKNLLEDINNLCPVRFNFHNKMFIFINSLLVK